MKYRLRDFIKTFDFVPLPIAATELQGKVIAGNKAFDSTVGLKTIEMKYLSGAERPHFTMKGHHYCVRSNEGVLEDKKYLLVFFIPLNDSIITTNEMLEILNASSDGLVVCDKDGTILLMNDSYAEIVGVDPEQFIGRPVQELTTKGYVPNLVTPRVIKKNTKLSMFLNVKGRDVLFTGAPVVGKDGQLKKVIANIRDLTELNSLVRQLAESEEKQKRYQEEIRTLQFQMSAGNEMVVNSKAMREIVNLGLRVAPSDCPVLITGESGTGKELMASLVHRNSDRAQKSFVAINCGALPLNIVESELFGYVGGAFTGAKSNGKPGLFELAHGGTIFLDEIGELDPSIQTKILRVIQEGELYRLGGKEPTQVDVRVIAATNRNLHQMVENGSFRQDLYYRLNVANISIPPLRMRHEDIPPLVSHFLNKFNTKYKCHKEFSSQTLQLFFQYSWPGNIREFQNIIERSIILSEGNRIENDLVFKVLYGEMDGTGEYGTHPNNYTFKNLVEEAKRNAIISEYKRLGSTRKVAKALGINQSTVVRQLKKSKELV